MYGDYEKMGKQTYLRLVAGEGEIRDEFACSMVSEAEISGLIRLYYAPSNGCDVYKYNITNYIRLVDFTKNYVSYEELIRIIRSIINTIREMGNYALSPNSIIVSKYSIYLNKNTMDVRMIFVPVKTNVSDTFEDLKNMLIDLIDNAPFREERLAGLSDKLSSGMIRNIDGLEREVDTLNLKYAASDEAVPVAVNEIVSEVKCLEELET